MAIQANVSRWSFSAGTVEGISPPAIQAEVYSFSKAPWKGFKN